MSITPPVRRRFVLDNSQPTARWAKVAWSIIVVFGVLVTVLQVILPRPYSPQEPHGSPGSDLPWPALAWMWLIVVTWLGIAVHEAGHALAARFVGFRVLYVLIGRLRIRPIGARFEIQWLKHRHPGGLAACVPVGTHDLVRRMCIVLIGGPAASLVFFLVSTAVWLRLSADGCADPRWFLPALATVIGLSLLASALWPRRSTTGRLTDGGYLWMLWRGGPAASRYASLLALESMIAVPGAKWSDVEPTLFEQATALADGSAQHTHACQLAYHRELALGRPDAAERYLNEALAHVDVYYLELRTSLLLTGAYFTARYRNDPAKARALLERAHHGITMPHERPLAEAAVLLAEDDTAGALAKAAEAERVAGPTPEAAGIVARRAQDIRLLAAARIAQREPDVGAESADA